MMKRRDISDDPELQAAFVHGMMFAKATFQQGLNIDAIGLYLCKVWDLGNVEELATEYGDKITALLLARPL